MSNVLFDNNFKKDYRFKDGKELKGQQRTSKHLTFS